MIQPTTSQPGRLLEVVDRGRVVAPLREQLRRGVDDLKALLVIALLQLGPVGPVAAVRSACLATTHVNFDASDGTGRERRMRGARGAARPALKLTMPSMPGYSHIPTSLWGHRAEAIGGGPDRHSTRSSSKRARPTDDARARRAWPPAVVTPPTAIVGVGEAASFESTAEATSLSLGAEAAVGAIADSGLDRSRIDGLLTGYTLVESALHVRDGPCRSTSESIRAITRRSYSAAPPRARW